MTKVKFSETDRFADIKSAIINTCTHVAIMNRYDCEDFVDNQIDAAFYALDFVFKDTCLGDTDSRSAAKMAIYTVLEKCPKDITKFKYIEDNIDCSMVLDDVLHMMTCNSDVYEYEGGNAMYSILEKLETI
jgi:hypothetical protein